MKTKQFKFITKQFKFVLLLIAIAISSITAFANNVVVSNVSLTNQNTTNHYTMVNFDISWDNSWRTSIGPSNWDAAWVFVKYRLKTQVTWHHATLNWVDGTGSGDGHTVPANSIIASSNDNGAGGAYGVFIYRNADMLPQGSVSYPGAKLRWNYGVDGVLDADSVQVCVFAIEMVYVPQGNFELGSGGTGEYHFYKYPYDSLTYTVSSENAITVGTSNGNLYYDPWNDELGGDRGGPIPAAFPKGYKAFYCMKYEVSQEQYADFLNKLGPAQDNNRYDSGNNGNNRYAIGGGQAAHTSTNPYVACNHVSCNDAAAYLDWAALRPMTELEFEKACRGTRTPAVADEYAWGTQNRACCNAYTLNNAGADNEGIASNYSTTGGNSANNETIDGNIDGPLRCGIFAANSNNSGRETAGASYYGIMELSGNLWELVITAGESHGRDYTGRNGDGVLDNSGNANTQNWPDYRGFGRRGGSWNENTDRMLVSDRYYSSTEDNGRSSDFGIRGVRWAP